MGNKGIFMDREQQKKERISFRLILRSVARTILGVVVGSSVFFALCLLLQYSIGPRPDFNIEYALFEFTATAIILVAIWVFVSMPAIIGGLILLVFVYLGLRKGNMSKGKSMVYGAILGGLVCLAISAFVIVTKYSFGPGHGYKYEVHTFDWLGHLSLALGAIVVASLVGGWTGGGIFADARKEFAG